METGMEPTLEQLTSDFMNMSEKEWDDDTLNSILDILFKELVDKTDKFPSVTLLENATRILMHLSSPSVPSPEAVEKPIDEDDVEEGSTERFSWPTDLRVVVRRLVQTFNAPEEYLSHCFVLCSLASRYLGHGWWKSDPETAVLLASLSSGRLRLFLDNPAEVKANQLVACLSLLEDFIQCVESDEAILDEKAATSVSRACQEAASYLCDCIIAFDGEQESSSQASASPLSGPDAGPHGAEINQVEYYMAIHRYLAAFLNVGGGGILDGQKLDTALPILQKICEFCMKSRDDYRKAEIPLVDLVQLRKDASEEAK